MIRYTKLALHDLLQIEEYSNALWGEEAADHYLEQLERACAKLERFPQLGATLHPPYREARCLPCDEHLIYYRVHGTDVVILRVRHKRQEKRW